MSDLPRARIYGGGRAGDTTRRGRVRGQARQIVDDAGVFAPLGASFFWALWGWAHDRERTEKNLAFLSAQGIDYFRMFGEVGGDSWADRVIDPRDPDYEGLLADLLDTAWHRYKLRAEITIFAGGTGAPLDLVTDKIRSVVESRLDAILDLEISNEDNGPTHDEQRRQVQRIRSWFPGLVATSSFGERDKDVVNFCTDHLERNLSDGDWRFVRQPWDVKGYRYPGAQNEPIGPHSSVEESSDPLRLAMLRAVGIMCGMTGFVFHTGAGVRGGGAADVARNPSRHANFWEYDFDGIVPGLQMAASLVPPDAPNWTKTRHQWPDHPLRTDEIWPDGLDHGVVRNHAAYGGRSFVSMPIGVKHYTTMIPMDACKIIVYHPLTGGIFEERTLRAGEPYVLMGADDAKASAAYIIVGERL